jgi:hypothetical protein
MIYTTACTPPVSGETRIYTEVTGEELITTKCKVEPSEQGYTIQIMDVLDDVVVCREELEVNSSFDTLSWSYTDKRKEIDMTAVRHGDIIDVTTHQKGQNQKKQMKINSSPWYQIFPLSFEKFASSNEKTTNFWSINPEEAKPYEFSLTKQQKTVEKVGDQQVDVVHIRVSLTGFLALFWHADSWHRSSDGKFMRYEGVNGRPGTQPTIVEFLREENEIEG